MCELESTKLPLRRNAIGRESSDTFEVLTALAMRSEGKLPHELSCEAGLVSRNSKSPKTPKNPKTPNVSESIN